MESLSTPFVSVIIPVYNDGDRLKIVLEALEAQTYPADAYEVIVVDNASDTSPADIVARFSHARLVFEAQRGSYAARNHGIAVAQGDYLAFTDADCIPYANWLENGMRQLQQRAGCGLIGGRIEVFAQEPHAPTTAELFELMYGFPVQWYISDRHYAPTGNLFTTRATFEQVGLFNGSLQSNGDREWGQRVHAHGGWLVYAEDAVVRHPARPTVAELMKKRRRVVSGQGQRARASGSFWRMFLEPTFWQGLIPHNLRFFRPLLSNRWTLRQRLAVLGVLIRMYVIGVFGKLRLLVSKPR